MQVRVLGSAAGGGFPQWNCNCRLCDGLRRGTVNARARTQSSIALRGDGEDWLLCNASPDLLTQLRQAPALQPARAVRDTGIGAVLLMDAQIDHVTGLAMLREHQRPLEIWCTAEVRGDLETANPLFRLLQHYCGIDWRCIEPGREFSIPTVPGLSLRALPIESNAPPYSSRRDRPAVGDNIALWAQGASGAGLFYAPALAEANEGVRNAMREAACVMVDGTCWTDDEMIALGLSRKTARAMGHRAISGDDGMLDWLETLPPRTRRILIHVNNTNPVLDEDGPEHAALVAAGVELAHDGLEFTL
ncbi:MAG: pyrroloquinoline quinone biosynthesis protein PqqB [Steroidobacteraceae bacterium]